MKATYAGSDINGWSLVNVECPSIAADGDLCEADVEISCDGKDGIAIVGTCPVGCEHDATEIDAMILAARAAIDNFDPSDAQLRAAGYL